jgi:hypothetical protein
MMTPGIERDCSPSLLKINEGWTVRTTPANAEKIRGISMRLGSFLKKIGVQTSAKTGAKLVMTNAFVRAKR